MAADGTITFSTALDNGQLERDLKAAEREIDALKKRLEKANSGKTAIEVDMERGEAAIHRTEEAVSQLQERLAGLEGADPTDSAAWDAAQGQISGVRAKLEEANAELEKQIADQDRLNDKWQRLDSEAQTYTQQIESATARQKELGEEYTRSYTKAGNALKSGLDGASASMNAFMARIGTMAKRLFVFGVILSALRSVKDMLGQALQENERFSASWEYLRATVRGVASAVSNLVAPAIIGMVNAAASAITWLARAIDTLFGTQIVAAIQSARTAAEASWRQTDDSKKAARAAEKQAKASKKLAQEQKKAVKSMMAFDEINAMQAESSADAADAINDEADAVGGGLRPDWDALDVGKIDDKLAEIMLALGAALMAVGAILAFSGINIPLGITLMAIGALMIYSAYQEQWDKLPQEVRDAITNALILSGIVMLVIGAVLAFSGVNVPLGIGLMAAGAIMLGTALALNWDSMPAELQRVITAIMVVLGGGLLAVGAILALSGANVPLGVGLMLAGAAVLGGAAALNWDSMADETKRAVSAVAAVVAVAFLAIGAVLTFSGANVPLGIALLGVGALTLVGVTALNWEAIQETLNKYLPAIEVIVGSAFLALGAVLTFSGANIPLGIALLIVGALALVHAIATDWDKMPSEVRNTVTTILGIIGGALIVIGIILCVTGVGIPLGIACILAGIGSFVVASAINWNFIQDKVRGIWEGIVQWWRNGPARVFTWQFWEGVFKSIINGLIYCINSGLNAFGSFVNWIGGGISDLLGMFGITGASFSISMPQIPYLAQGAVIPPNREFLAVLGDQSRGNNIEAPESLMRQVVREEAGSMLADALMALSSGDGGAGRDIVLMVGRKELARETVRGMRDLDRTGELGSLGIAFG